MSKTAWIIFSVFTIGILAVLVIFSNNSRLDVSKVDINKVQSASGQNGHIADHVFGKADSKVVMVEYGDFQCPACGTAYPWVKKVTSQYSKQIAYIFRNYPLPQLHPNAKAAAAAAESAGLQGKYWEMHDILYETQQEWSNLSTDDRTKFFQDIANRLHLNSSKFNTDIISTSIEDKINFDVALGKKAGVQGTPSIFINGKSFTIYNDPRKNEDNLKDILNSELKKNNISLPQ
jgi:protein-disulfide isomerase